MLAGEQKKQGARTFYRIAEGFTSIAVPSAY
jgi:hypothetical protein